MAQLNSNKDLCKRNWMTVRNRLVYFNDTHPICRIINWKSVVMKGLACQEIKQRVAVVSFTLYSATNKQLSKNLSDYILTTVSLP